MTKETKKKSILKNITKYIIQTAITLNQGVKTAPIEQKTSDIIPEYYLNGEFDKSQSKMLEHDFFKKNLEKVIAQKIDIKIRPIIKVRQSIRVLLPERAQSEEITLNKDRILQEEKILRSIEIPLQRPYNSSLEKRFTRSDLFWPAFNSEKNSFKNLGLNILNTEESQTYSGELISSMVFFEKTKFQDINEVQKLFFKAMILTPTASKQYLRNVLDSQITTKEYDEDHNSENKQYMKCDSAEYVSNAKVYILCWRILADDEKDVRDSANKGVIKFFLRVYDPLLTNHRNVFQLKDTTSITFNTLKIKESEFKEIRTHLSFNGVENSTNLVIWEQSGNFFLIIKIQNDRFGSLLYPHEEHARYGVDEFWLRKKNSETFLDEKENVIVKKIYTLMKDCFIVQAVEKIGEKEIDSVYYINSYLNRHAKKVDNGIFLNIENKDKGDSKLFRQIFVFNIEDEKNGRYKGKLKTLIFDSDNFYYNGNSMEIEAEGEAKLHQFWSSDSYYIHASTKVEGGKISEKEIRSIKKIGKIYICSKEDPDIYIQLIELNDYVAIDVSPQNDFIYVRSKFKTDVMRLQQILVNVNITDLVKIMAEPKENRLLQEKKELQPSEYFKFYFLKKPDNDMKYTPEQFDPNKSEFKQLIIESFMVMHYPYKDLFKVKSLYPSIELAIDQTSTVPIKFNFLNFGNFILFKSLSSLDKTKESNKEDNDAIISAFSEYNPYIDGPSNTTKDVSDAIFIQSIFAIKNQQHTYYFLNTGGNPSNSVWYYNSDFNKFELFLRIQDHRKLQYVEFLDKNNYLLEIGESIYHLDVVKKRYRPIYKSDDLCGKVSVVVHHSMLGKLTVCGGDKRLSIFDTDTERNKIDFSIPNKNIHIDEIIQNEFKTLKIASLVSSKNHPNHFGLISEIVVETINKQISTQGGSNSVNQNTLEVKKHVKIRFYEICVGKEKIEIFLEESQTVYLPPTTESVMPFLIGKYFVILITHKPTKDTTNLKEFIYEEIRTFKITNAFDIKEEKVYLQDNNIKLNFAKNAPIVTLLEESSNTKANKIQKIAFLSEVTINIKNEIADLYFEDRTKVINVITVFDPSLPSLSCMNIITLPDGYEPLKMGPLMINSGGEFKGIGLLIYGKKYHQHRIFHMINHHFEIDFHFYRNLESVFRANTTNEKKFRYELVNLQSSDERETKLAEVKFKISNRAPDNIELAEDLASGKKITFDLMSSKHKIIELTDEKDNLKVKGAMYGIDFIYESPLERKTDRLLATYMNKKLPMPDDKIYKAKMSLWEELKFKYEYGTFETSKFDYNYPVYSMDYIELLSMDRNMVMTEDKAKGKWNYLSLFRGMRRVSSGKVVMEYDISEQGKDVVKILKYAEIGAGIIYDPEKPKELKVYIFDNYTNYANMTEKDDPKDQRKTFDFIKKTISSQRITKQKIELKNQTVTIKYDNEIDLNRIRIQKSLNALVICQFAQSRDVVVEYDLILLRGIMRNEKEMHKAYVVPVNVTKRKMHEKVWWYDINVMTNLMYTKKNSVNKLMERICIVGVFRTNKLNLYFRCATDYAHYKDMNLEKSEFFNKTNFRAIVEDSLGDLKKSKEPLIKGIDAFYNLGKYLGVKGNEKEARNYMSNDVQFTIKVPDKMNYLLRLNPNLNEGTKTLQIYMREIYNPFAGFKEHILFQDISMGNVYIRPIIFKKKSFIAYYFLGTELNTSDKVSYTLQVINCNVEGYKTEGVPEAKKIEKSPQEVDKELKDNIISPIQIFNFTGSIVNLVSFQLFSKNEKIKESFLERLFNFSKPVETGRTVVCRAFEEKCSMVPLDSYDILVKVNVTLTYSQIYKLNFMPQIEIVGKSQYLVSDWIRAKFRGFFNKTEDREITVKSVNLVNPLFLITYSAPLLVLLAFLVCLTFVLRYLFAIYTLKMTEEINRASPFSQLLMRYTTKKEGLIIGLKNVNQGKNKSFDEESSEDESTEKDEVEDAMYRDSRRSMVMNEMAHIVLSKVAAKKTKDNNEKELSTEKKPEDIEEVKKDDEKIEEKVSELQDLGLKENLIEEGDESSSSDDEEKQGQILF